MTLGAQMNIKWIDNKILGVAKKYVSLKSHIFVLRTDGSLTLVSFVRQDLNLNFET